MEQAFDTDKYLSLQYQKIKERIELRPHQPTYIEFGGKPGDDHHAARVLPGYRPDAKIELLQELIPISTIIMVLNARDILLPPHGRYQQGRIRGDSGLFYADETLRLVDLLDNKGLKPHGIVLSVTPKVASEEDQQIINYLEIGVQTKGIPLYRHYAIEEYPSLSIFENPEMNFNFNQQIAKNNENLVVFSPGGGSGKFGVILAELYFALKRGLSPNFVKFETFPVFNLHSRHPLNLAFEAATADLNNKVQQVITNEGQVTTTYDKDIENFKLLQKLYEKYNTDPQHPILKMTQPTEMGVNIIESGIINMECIIKACKLEILRRLRRYRNESKINIEKPETVTKVKQIWMETKIG